MFNINIEYAMSNWVICQACIQRFIANLATDIRIVFCKRNLDINFEGCIIISTEPTTPLFFMRNPVGLFHLWGVLCINIQNKY